MGESAALHHTEISAFAFDITEFLHFSPAPPPKQYTPLKETRRGDQFSKQGGNLIPQVQRNCE